mmetsp:Transcript_45352/g.147377  ORF Transcript_45352/g.147377 Transcript_45352/m.147377 type:complete len:214 (+) Transcript_45352:63-704(+)
MSTIEGLDPRAAVADMADAFDDYVCDAGDALEAALKGLPELAENHQDIEQGVDRWLLKVQRAADVSFDRFEASALEQSFHVPDGLMAASSGGAADADDEEAEAAQLWEQLQQRVAAKRELRRKIAALRRLELAWEAQQPNFEQLSGLSRAEGVHAVMDKAARLKRVLGGLGGARDGGALVAKGGCGGAAPRHHEAIRTASVSDLRQLSTALCS